jgi:tRNA (cytidine32/uridine32-2'-O)-methyltransferase
MFVNLCIDNIKIVLVETSHPGNIGSVARAMKTMGFGELVLVKPRYFPHETATDLAAGADDVLINATVVQTLPEALADCSLVFGTSVRPRGIDMPALTARAAAPVITDSMASQGKVAIVFGRERTGLTNDELKYSNYHVYIPSSPDYGSLNLAQAVQIMCYEIRMRLLEAESLSDPVKAMPLATSFEVEGLFHHLAETLTKIEFYKPGHSKRLLARLRRLFKRTQLETMEVNILRGILTAVERRVESRDNP